MFLSNNDAAVGYSNVRPTSSARVEPPGISVGVLVLALVLFGDSMVVGNIVPHRPVVECRAAAIA